MMRYFKGMLDFGLYYTRDHDFRLVVTPIHIELEVFLIERALQDVVSVWGQP